MKLLVISHKPCWADTEGRCSTDGGFPFQVRALSELFEETTLVACRSRRDRPQGLTPLVGRRLRCRLLTEPRGSGAWRKAWMASLWLPLHLAELRRRIRDADVVHALVPGDVGALGALLTRQLGRRLAIRHCGTWGHDGTFADRWLASWLPRVASEGVVVFATGGGDRPPVEGVSRAHWIFSTSLTEHDLRRLAEPTPWSSGEPLRLIFVGRLTRGKNAAAAIGALPELQRRLGRVTLDILGDGPELQSLRTQARTAGVAESVRLLGNMSHDQVLGELCKAHMAVFPTRVAEGFPKAVVEAMACGVPVLASRVSVLPRLLNDGVGLLLDAPDSDSLIRGVLSLATEPSELAAMGARAKARAQQYTLERWRDRIGQILTEEWGDLSREVVE